MALKTSDELRRDENREHTTPFISDLHNEPINPSVHDGKPSRSALPHSQSPTKNIKKFAESCMPWRRKIPLSSKSSRSTTPLRRLSADSNDGGSRDDEKNDRLLPESISISKFSNTSWDCISTLIDELEHSEQLCKIRHTRESDHEQDRMAPQHASHLLKSKESLSLQTIYDGEIFGKDHGSTGVKDREDTGEEEVESGNVK